MKILIPEIIQGLGSSFLAQRAFFAETVLGGYGLSAGAVPAFP